MESFLKIIIILFLIFLFNCKKKLTESDKDNTLLTNQWTPLFNGKNLDDWNVKINGYALNDNYKNTFRVENNILKVSYLDYDHFTDQYGHLFYKIPFSNYKLRLQYRFTGEQALGGQSWAKKNSGIMIHCQPPETMLLKQKFPLSLEVQLLGGITEGDPRPTGNICTPATHIVMGDKQITEHCVMADCKTYYGQEWVSVEIHVNKDSITHYIDKKHVITYSKPTIGGAFLNTASKSIQAKEGQPLKSGYISLQSESHPIEFKNIEILEL